MKKDLLLLFFIKFIIFHKSLYMIIFIILTGSKKFSMRLDFKETVVILVGRVYWQTASIRTVKITHAKIFVVTRKPNNHEELRILAGLGQITIVELKDYNENNLNLNY